MENNSFKMQRNVSHVRISGSKTVFTYDLKRNFVETLPTINSLSFPSDWGLGDYPVWEEGGGG
jgi:hypothetical protein